jgi:RNA 3'-terminal phosphate cyclase (ATP)
LSWLAKATDAKVAGLSVGSKVLDFAPSSSPTALREREVLIKADTASASACLIFQAILPYLLFAGSSSSSAPTNSTEDDSVPSNATEQGPLEVTIEGGTNVTWSMSYEYLDQVTLPALEHFFGLHIGRRLSRRAWATGSPGSHGSLTFEVTPIPPGQTIRYIGPRLPPPTSSPALAVTAIDASILAPSTMHTDLQNALAADVDALFPDADLNFVLTEESRHETRMYVLLVARCRDGPWRWGRDHLYQGKRKGTSEKVLAANISRRVARDLFAEVQRDEFCEDQLVVFQALAEGLSSFPPERSGADVVSTEAVEGMRLDGTAPAQGLRKDKAHEPFGRGSVHASTARWVLSELLPEVDFYRKGEICRGVGFPLGRRAKP